MVNRLDSCQRCLGGKLEGSVERCGQQACDGKEEGSNRGDTEKKGQKYLRQDKEQVEEHKRGKNVN